MMASRCPWYIAGPLLGLLIVGLRAAVNKPLGALGGYIDIVDGATRTHCPHHRDRTVRKSRSCHDLVVRDRVKDRNQ